jgi:hypothetical protein
MKEKNSMTFMSLKISSPNTSKNMKARNKLKKHLCLDRVHNANFSNITLVEIKGKIK